MFFFFAFSLTRPKTDFLSARYPLLLVSLEIMVPLIPCQFFCVMLKENTSRSKFKCNEIFFSR
jgi:hypothetical protein